MLGVYKYLLCTYVEHQPAVVNLRAVILFDMADMGWKQRRKDHARRDSRVDKFLILAADISSQPLPS